MRHLFRRPWGHLALTGADGKVLHVGADDDADAVAASLAQPERFGVVRPAPRRHLGHPRPPCLRSVAGNGDDQINSGSGPGGPDVSVGDQVSELLNEIVALVTAKAPGVEAEQGSANGMRGRHLRPSPGAGWSG